MKQSRSEWGVRPKCSTSSLWVRAHLKNGRHQDGVISNNLMQFDPCQPLVLITPGSVRKTFQPDELESLVVLGVIAVLKSAAVPVAG